MVDVQTGKIEYTSEKDMRGKVDRLLDAVRAAGVLLAQEYAESQQDAGQSTE